jgi:CheY-like chemotaxis protein
MRILFVEDNKTFAASVERSLAKMENVSVTTAMSRETALKALRTEFFDLLILDLSMPTTDGGLDTAPEHGQAVFYEAQTVTKGTPIYILTGSDPDAFSSRLARHGERIDLWGTGVLTHTIDYRVKEDADLLVEDVKNIAAEIARTDAISLDTRGRNIGLTPEQKRTLRVFTRRHGGVSCLIEQLGGGLSDARVLRATVRDDRGHARALCVAKLGSAENVHKESMAYDQHVKLLRMGAATPLVMLLDQGVRGFAGIFYTLAEGHDQTLFDVIAERVDVLPKIVSQVRDSLSRWSLASNVRQVKIRDIRRRVLKDESLVEIEKQFGLALIDHIENIDVRVAESCIHGDLHGGNILVNRENVPVLIDFGDVGQGFTCLDPITLELSMLFHPDGKKYGLADHIIPKIEHWPDIETYVDKNPLGAAIQACRDWAHDVGASDKAVLAAGYSFAVRQLKYDTVDPTITLKLIHRIGQKLLAHDA